MPDREGVPSQLMDSNRRTILATGAATTAMAAAPRVFAQQTEQEAAPISFYAKGPAPIHFQETASRVASGDGRPFLRRQYEDLGSRAVQAPARHHDGDHRKIPDQDVPQQPRLRFYCDARFRPQLPDARADPAG